MSTTDAPVGRRPQIAVFRALLASHVAMTVRVTEILDETCGLSMREFDMIAELGRQSELNMGDLSTRMITSPSSVTRIAKALEAKGLVSRHRSEHSEREVVASLTAEGEAFFEEHFFEVADRLSAHVDAQLEPAEQLELRRLLDRLGRVSGDAG